MNFKEAVSIVRKNYPNRLIWDGFEYAGKYIFSLAIDNKYVPGDTALQHVSIEKESGKHQLFDFWNVIYKDPNLQKVSRMRTLVDVTKEQADAID